MPENGFSLTRIFSYKDRIEYFGTPVYRFGRPKNTVQVFFFQLYCNKKYVEVAINDFTMHLIIPKCFRIRKYRQQRKTIRQRGRSERRNCQRKCFHSFNYVIDHVSIRFFFYVNSLLLRVISSVLLAASFNHTHCLKTILLNSV